MKKKKLSLLIVDDNIHFVHRMLSLLKDVDNIYAIHTAHNYDDAFILLDKRPDLAILDIQLPGKNGMALLKRIKDTTNYCEVVMLSNCSGPHYREQCKKLGALRFFDKTNDFDLVPAMINDYVIQGHKNSNGSEKAFTIN